MRRAGVIATAACLGSIGLPAGAAPFQTIVVQPIQVCETNNTGCAPLNLNSAPTNVIYGQADIGITYLAPKILNNSAFTSVDVVANNLNQLDEARQLLRGAPLASLGLSANSSILNMFFVDELRETNLDGSPTAVGAGAAGFAFINGNGIIVDKDARIDTIAHEIGHNAGLDHTTFGAGASNNLMTDGGTRLSPSTVGDIAPNGQARDLLTAAQIDEARNPLFSVDLAKVTAQAAAAACAPFTDPAFSCFRVAFDTLPGGSTTAELKSLQLRFATDPFETIHHVGGGLFRTGIFGTLNPDPGGIGAGTGVTGTAIAPELSLLAGNGLNVKFTFASGQFDFGDQFVILDLPDLGESGAPLSFRFDFANGFSTSGAFDGTSASSADPFEITFEGTPFFENFNVPDSLLGEVDPPGIAAVPEPPTALLLAGVVFLLGWRAQRRGAARIAY